MNALRKHGGLYSVALCLLLFLCACTGPDAAMGIDPKDVPIDTLDDVEMYTEQAVYQPGEAEITVIMHNGGQAAYAFDMQYMLQILNGDAWEIVDKGETIVWVDADFVLEPGGTAEQSLALTNYTDDIRPGQYRILKPIYSADKTQAYYIAATFSVYAGDD